MARNTPETGCGCRVPVSEVLAALGLPPISLAAGVWRGAEVFPDWRGNPSVAVADAAAIVAAHQAQARAMDEARTAQEAQAQADAEAERALDQAAFTAAYNAKGGMRGGPAAYAAGMEAIRRRRLGPVGRAVDSLRGAFAGDDPTEGVA
ncbi:MAG: hypothetical protein WAL50_12470 [Kineosporiaceae bacterium]